MPKYESVFLPLGPPISAEDAASAFAAIEARKAEPKPKARRRRAGSPTPRREKVFGDGRPRPMDRNVKVRILHLARVLTLRTEKGKAYGAITAKALAVMEALLWQFHNARSGLCFPGYEKIAEAAHCARSTVGAAIKALEGVGLLSWVNRLVRVRVLDPVLGSRVRVIRTSNAYEFHDPNPGAKRAFSSKAEKPAVTSIQDSSLACAGAKTAENAAIARLAALAEAQIE